MKKILIGSFASSVILFAQGIDYKYDFNARIEYDIGNFNITDDKYSESKVRRARVSHKGAFFDKKLFYEIEVDGANYLNSDEDNELEFKDNYIGYKNKSKYLDLSYRFKVGNTKVPFSLDSYSGSRYSSFMESPLTDTFTQNRKLGIEGLFSKKVNNHKVNLFLGAFKNSIDEKRDDDIDKIRKAIKTTYSYKFSKNHLLHFGGSYLYSKINDDNIKYSQEAESNLILHKYISTKVKNVDTTKDTELELLYIKNSFHFQAEYIQSKVNTDVDDYSFSGYYAQVGYFLFGSSKNFKTTNSKFSGKKMNNKDVELALRYSKIDLNDKDEQGGVQKDYNLGVNWYFNKNIKLMSNYIIAYPKSDEYNGKFRILQGRIAISF